jgi:tetratricopeptide (TPR) repeat protein
MEILKSSKQQGVVKGFDFVIGGALALVFFLCPLFFTGFAAQGIGFEKMILFYFLVLLAAVAWVSKGIMLGDLQLKRTPLDWPILGTLVVLAVSTVLSVSQKDSLIGSYGNPAKGLIAFLAFVLFYYLVVNNINISRIKLFFWALIASSALVSVYSLLQIFSVFLLPLAITKTASFNPLGSLSSLTAYILISLPLLVILASQAREIFSETKSKLLLWAIQLFAGAIIIIDLVILFVLSGFTFWPAALAGIVVILMFLLAKIIKTGEHKVVIPMVVFGLLIIQLILGSFNFFKLNLPTEVSLSRKASWDIAKNNIQKNPFFGSGPSTFYYSFSKFKSPDFNQTLLWNARFDSANGGLFESMATTGALGTVGLVIMVLIALSIAFIALLKAAKKEMQLILLSLFSSFIVMLLIALLLTMSSTVILYAVLVSVLTVSVAVVIYPEKFKTLNLAFRTSAKYALALSAIFLVVSAGVVILFTMGLKMYLADIYAQRSLTQTDQTKKIEMLTRAVQLAPYQDKYYIELANSYLSLANQEATTRGDQTAIGNYLSLAIDGGKTAVELAPNSAANNESLALIYENASFYVRGALEWSENLYKKVADLDPNNPTPDLRMALIDVARANLTQDKTEKETYLNDAIKKYGDSIAKKGDLAAAYYGEAIAYEKMDKKDESIEQLKKAVVLSGDNLDYKFELGRLYFNRGVVKPDLGQGASADITTGQTDPGLSVSPDSQTGGRIARNDDLTNAEQLFLNILANNPNHANSLYSLALLYQKIGETSNARAMVTKLLEILPEDATKDAVRKQFTGLY